MRAAAAVAVTVMTAALLGACAEKGTWQNSSVPEEQWSEDKADCQRRARNQAEREFAITEQSNRSVSSGGMAGGPASPNSQWQSDMNRFSAQKRETRLFQDCMSSKGYTFVPTGKSTGSDADQNEAPADQAAPADAPAK